MGSILGDPTAKFNDGAASSNKNSVNKTVESAPPAPAAKKDTSIFDMSIMTKENATSGKNVNVAANKPAAKEQEKHWTHNQQMESHIFSPSPASRSSTRVNQAPGGAQQIDIFGGGGMDIPKKPVAPASSSSAGAGAQQQQPSKPAGRNPPGGRSTITFG